MDFNKYKGFGLVEVMIVIGVVSLVLAISAPILTKRVKNTQDSGCVGGERVVKKVFVGAFGDSHPDDKDHLAKEYFTVPDNINSDITVTLVGGGGGGAIAEVTNKSSICYNCRTNCVIAREDANTKSFISRITLSTITKSATQRVNEVCLLSKQGGESGTYFTKTVSPRRDQAVEMVNYGTAETVSASLVNPDDTKEPIAFDAYQPVLAEKGINGVPYFLNGGIPDVYFAHENNSASDSYVGFPLGWGGNCKASATNNNYVNHQTFSHINEICKREYVLVEPGAGGGAGAYAKFNISLNGGVQCEVSVGKGGARDVVNSGALSTDGQGTSLKCNNVTYWVDGGRKAKEVKTGASKVTTPGKGGSSFSSNIPTSSRRNGNSGNMPLENNTIAGGTGGSVIDLDGNVFSEGKKGGCFGAMTGKQCDNPYGENAKTYGYELKNPGAGGGGGSCSSDYCGSSGGGSNGIVILEYRTKCY